MDNAVLELLTLIVSTVIGGLFAFIWRLWARMNRVEKRLEQAETAIFEGQHVCNLLGLGYESLRLLGLEVVRGFRDHLKKFNHPEPASLGIFEAKPEIGDFMTEAQRQAREATRQRNGE
jgi:hypothetical protein